MRDRVNRSIARLNIKGAFAPVQAPPIHLHTILAHAPDRATKGTLILSFYMGMRRGEIRQALKIGWQELFSRDYFYHPRRRHWMIDFKRETDSQGRKCKVVSTKRSILKRAFPCCVCHLGHKHLPASLQGDGFTTY